MTRLEFLHANPQPHALPSSDRQSYLLENRHIDKLLMRDHKHRIALSHQGIAPRCIPRNALAAGMPIDAVILNNDPILPP